MPGFWLSSYPSMSNITVLGSLLLTGSSIVYKPIYACYLRVEKAEIRLSSFVLWALFGVGNSFPAAAFCGLYFIPQTLFWCLELLNFRLQLKVIFKIHFQACLTWTSLWSALRVQGPRAEKFTPWYNSLAFTIICNDLGLFFHFLIW